MPASSPCRVLQVIDEWHLDQLALPANLRKSLCWQIAEVQCLHQLQYTSSDLRPLVVRAAADHLPLRPRWLPLLALHLR